MNQFPCSGCGSRLCNGECFVEEESLDAELMKSHSSPDTQDPEARAAIQAMPDSPVTVMQKALEKCRDKFAEYVELHKAKLPARPDIAPPANWREIAEKVERNAEMVAICDEALARISR